MNRTSSFLSAAALAFIAAGPAYAGGVEVLDLSSFGHGDVVNGIDLNGVTIGAENFHTTEDFAVVFNTSARHTADRDLEGPNGHGKGSFKLGNLAESGTVVGNAIIIQEPGRNLSADGASFDVADDEGRRPAGNLFFSFENAIDSFGFDLIDVEGNEEFTQGSGFFATFTSMSTTVSVAFRDLVDPAKAFFDSTVSFGDNSANRIQPITAAQLGLQSFDNVRINLGGSGAVGNINYTESGAPTAVPTPSAAVAGLGMLVLAGRRRRRQG